ncbi:hypothetical protein XH99_01415 [Bradyrhizobium nanningense]|uniref:Uncharacterized protein n=1 Tax=Bradyrhizobium nanningense TaxID=1325118 RepID=A0A4Q0SK62_9BRAD|nr:hypothetical protein [Bradyrhizobium nanningense]RXH23970.1 hypothetical protein XH84_33310 [Bradyrhizobium nanningense]RXH38431.1 hypothetical protein XH99_01415 [Bradyrhizobium nanningense]
MLLLPVIEGQQLVAALRQVALTCRKVLCEREQKGKPPELGAPRRRRLRGVGFGGIHALKKLQNRRWVLLMEIKSDLQCIKQHCFD